MTTETALTEYPKTVVLLDGTHLVLRPSGPEDTEAVASLVARLAADEQWYVGHDLRISAARAEAGELLGVLALDGERVVGWATLERTDEGSRRHAARVSLVLDPEFRGRRLGTWMLLDCVHVAGILGAERLVAEVPEHRRDHIAALRRLDFTEEAILRDAHRTPTGEPEAAVVLVKTLHPAWGDF